ncbi:multicopper oxidase domain-containing protein [Streptomyces subrutilus]|uniref:Plastocyanin-like domain-containing protein n=1 Tax=Streptomyces subrutilus TaxID=36818 RepID=A0A1E5PQI2_9ACTN|nr:hypothetical protein BGK67_10870 [Streptomyces subrutilus]
MPPLYAPLIVEARRDAMWHPVHLHGHTFAPAGEAGGARKDTAVLLPGGRLTADFDADDPGLWMPHCHNVYRSDSGDDDGDRLPALVRGKTRRGPGGGVAPLR